MTTIVLVGGFLGAGKTTLILRAADMLRARGRRVAVILNDQDAGLVDTRLAEAAGLDAREVDGGCFCCRFGDLLDRIEALRPAKPDIIFAEPVGSCLDLASTVIHPLQQWHSDEYRVAPLSVLVDPARTRGYLVERQIAEADLVVATKADLHPRADIAADFRVSAVTGQGVAEWLDEVLSGRRVAGAHVVDIDYDRYAAAEAELGWVNLHAAIRLREPAAPAAVAGPILDRIEDSIAEIAHLKVFDRASTGCVKASLTAKGQDPSAAGDLLADPAAEHELVVNLRAPAAPEHLRAAVERALSALNAEIDIRHFSAFSPEAPSSRPERG